MGSPTDGEGAFGEGLMEELRGEKQGLFVYGGLSRCSLDTAAKYQDVGAFPELSKTSVLAGFFVGGDQGESIDERKTPAGEQDLDGDLFPGSLDDLWFGCGVDTERESSAKLLVGRGAHGCVFSGEHAEFVGFGDGGVLSFGQPGQGFTEGLYFESDPDFFSDGGSAHGSRGRMSFSARGWSRDSSHGWMRWCERCGRGCFGRGNLRAFVGGEGICVVVGRSRRRASCGSKRWVGV